MLRLAVLLLLLANAGYFAWSQGLLRAWGLAPAQQSEPHRLRQQIKPQSLRILRDEEARRRDTAVATKTVECLQAGPFEETQMAGLALALNQWPAGSWSVEPLAEPGRWIVYMGKYATLENTARKKAELRQIGVSFEPLADPALEPGLSLGGFSSQAEADQQLEALVQRGVRSARVVQERTAPRGHLLKLAAVDDSLRSRLQELRPALNGKTLRPCR